MPVNKNGHILVKKKSQQFQGFKMELLLLNDLDLRHEAICYLFFGPLFHRIRGPLMRLLFIRGRWIIGLYWRVIYRRSRRKQGLRLLLLQWRLLLRLPKLRRNDARIWRFWNKERIAELIAFCQLLAIHKANKTLFWDLRKRCCKFLNYLGTNGDKAISC